MRIVFLLILIILLSFCNNRRNDWKEKEEISPSAKGFEIQYFSGYKIITVNNLWQKHEGQGVRYILSSQPEMVPDSLVKESIIKIPVRRVIAFSTTHVGYISILGKSSSIVGVSGKDFISDEGVRKAIESEECMDIGFAPNIDFERILMLKPDLVFLYGLDPSVSALVKRLADAGIPAVLVSEFLEFHPLGKAEWIKFFAEFYDCESTADSIYNMVQNNYTEIKNKAAELIGKPSVLVGLPFKDTWYMAGGRSFTAKFIEDAGGDYLWKENTNSDYIPMDLESVFQKAKDADIWINTSTVQNKQEILSYDPRLQFIRAFNQGSIFNNNLRLNSFGGNDFWESGSVRPDLILEDMVHIFHPETQNNYKFYYYKEIQ